MMKRIQSSDFNKPLEGSPIEQEVAHLREENRRLQGLLELREDRSEMERFQIQSRNKLLGLFGVTVFCLAAAGLYVAAMRAQLNADIKEIKDQRQTIYQLKNRSVIVDTSTTQ